VVAAVAKPERAAAAVAHEHRKEAALLVLLVRATMAEAAWQDNWLAVVAVAQTRWVQTPPAVMVGTEEMVRHRA
jgi:hypothetical protein